MCLLRGFHALQAPYALLEMGHSHFSLACAIHLNVLKERQPPLIAPHCSAAAAYATDRDESDWGRSKDLFSLFELLFVQRCG